jgi:hypothetical protein
MRISYTSTSLALAAALTTGSVASANHIDFIQDDSDSSNGVTNATFSLSTGGATVTDTQVGEPADILGGSRAVSLTRNGGFGGTISAEKIAGTSFIRVENSSVSAGTFVLDYPGISNSDFASMWDSIAVAIPVLDQSGGPGDGEINLSVTVESSAGTGTAFADGTGLAPGRIEDPGTFFFPFDDPNFAGVDFSDVDGVTVTFETAIIGSDFEIASITREVIPEPTSLALLGMGGLALLRRRRA